MPMSPPDSSPANPSSPDSLSETDERLLRRAIEVSAQAVANGDLPFGAVFADAAGNLLEAPTTGRSAGNILYHAETNLMHELVRTLTLDQRAAGTFYSSCEPCPMCAGSIYWGGITRLVFGLGEQLLFEIANAQNTTPVAVWGGCRLILEQGARHIEVSGPHLEAEAAAVHEGCWNF